MLIHDDGFAPTERSRERGPAPRAPALVLRAEGKSVARDQEDKVSAGGAGVRRTGRPPLMPVPTRLCAVRLNQPAV